MWLILLISALEEHPFFGLRKDKPYSFTGQGFQKYTLFGILPRISFALKGKSW